MKDQYAGDVGDFGKFGLLRALVSGADGGPEFRLGVIWYLTPDDNSSDGRHTSYLRDSKEREYRSCDPHVYDRLRAVVREDRRSVAGMVQDGVLPPDTLFYTKLLSFSGIPLAQRLRVRERWASGAYETMGAAQLVFLDPDNGLAPPSWRPRSKTAPKHAPLPEIEPLMARDRSVVIYHHLSMREPHPVQIERWLTRIARHASVAPFALRFRRGSGRAFFVVPASAHVGPLRHRAEMLITGQWGQRGHFDPVIYEAEATA